MNATSSALLSRAQAMNAKQAWAVLAAGVLGYEVVCKDGQLLSECVDEWLASRPILTRAAIAAMALHLGNAVPARYDFVSLGFSAIRRSSRVGFLASTRWRVPAWQHRSPEDNTPS